MPSAVSNEFVTFTRQIGLRAEHAEALWQADIRTPQELGSLEIDQLREICNNPVLLNFIHPLLKKYVFNITTASDPFKKALQVIKKNTPKEDEDMEVTHTVSDSTASDALGYYPDGPTQERPSATTPTQERPSATTPTRERQSATTFGNTGAKVSATGREFAQTNMGDEQKHKKFGISIHGGNFVQANILGTGPVTYNNTNTMISTTLGSGADAGMSMDLRKLRQKRLNESFVLNGKLVQMKDVGWVSGEEYWIGDDLKVLGSSKDLYNEYYTRNDVYQVRNFGQNRALIINNYDFKPEARQSKRNGAERDTENMQRTLTQLGFRVTCEKNMTKVRMLQLLREFAESDENLGADMVTVYIGSHGERDNKGCDTFVGVDGGRIKFEEVKAIFSSSKCRYLAGKPKIFFLQFCRQDNTPPPARTFMHPSSDGRRTRYDGEPFVEGTDDDDMRPMDFLCVYATLAGSKAYRDTLDGSWFVSCLVRVLTESANKEDLLSMLVQVNNSVSEKDGQDGEKRALQISEVVHNLRKKIFFWPGMK